MKTFSLYFVALLTLISCSKSTELESYIQEVKKGEIVKIFRQKPSNIHEEISPKYYAITSENDTISCSRYSKIGSTIYFIKHHK